MRSRILIIAATISASTIIASGSAFGATNAANLSAKCSKATADAGFRHSGATGDYTAQATIKCSETFKYTIVVKDNGAVVSSVTSNFGRFGADSTQTNATPAIPVVPGHRYQVVVTVKTGSGKSLGYITSGEPQVLVNPTRQSLARYLLSSSKVNTSGRLVASDLKAAAKNAKSSAGALLSAKLLGVLVEISTKHSFTITALESGGTGHHTGSLHYSGAAFDLGRIDGVITTGRDPGSIAVINQIKGLLPSGSAFGQAQCGTTVSLPPGVSTFEDSCNHLHVQVPRGTA